MNHDIAKSTENELAAEYLCLNGYTILEKNFRHSIGKIDIIAKKNDVLTFVIINTSINRKSENLSFNEQMSIRKAAQYYLSVNGILNHMPPLSFDIINIIRFTCSNYISFNYYPHSF